MKKGFLASIAAVAAFSATIGMSTVSASSKATGEINFEGVNKVNTNETFYQDIMLSGVNGDLITFGTGISVSDNTCIELDHIETLDDDADSNLDRLVFVSIDGFNGNKKIARVYFKSLNNSCKTKIYLDEPTMSFIDNTDIETFKQTAKEIEVKKQVEQKNSVVTPSYKTTNKVLENNQNSKNTVNNKTTLFKSFSSKLINKNKKQNIFKNNLVFNFKKLLINTK